MILIIKNKRGTFEYLIDADDAEKVCSRKWRQSNAVNLCLRTNKLKTDPDWFPKTIFIHRYLMELYNHDDKLQIDHINRNVFDNRKCNLRIVTNRNNSLNTGPKRLGEDRLKGVSLNKKTGKYMAAIAVHKKLIYIGSFDDKIVAAKAYDQLARHLFKEFAYLNFPNENDIVVDTLKIIKKIPL